MCPCLFSLVFIQKESIWAKLSGTAQSMQHTWSATCQVMMLCMVYCWPLYCHQVHNKFRLALSDRKLMRLPHRLKPYVIPEDLRECVELKDDVTLVRPVLADVSAFFLFLCYMISLSLSLFLCLVNNKSNLQTAASLGHLH